MFKNSLSSFLSTCRELARHWQAVAIMAALYLLLLGALYGFITTREATAIQILQTLLFAAAAPFIFFLLQAAIIGQARDGEIYWYAALKRSCKLALTAFPVVAVGLALMWVTNRWQSQISIPYAPFQSVRPTNEWSLMALSTFRTLLVAVVVPLVLIHVWLETMDRDLVATVRGGADSTLKWLRGLLVRSFAAESVLLYFIGFLLFAAVPYVLLFVHLPFQSQWGEFGAFAGRLGVAIFASLLGWVATLSTFTRRHAQAVAKAEEISPVTN